MILVKFGYCLFLVGVLRGINSEDVEEAPTVTTKAGTFLGTTKEVNAYGKNVKINHFFGIPYAEAPVDDLRFRKPVPKKVFTSPFDATKFGNVCLQVLLFPLSDEKTLKQSEDCLNLNIYVPAESKGDLPVMVWIHGGAFVCGAGQPYVADTLSAQGNVIVVTLNYRLTLWGFLSTKDEHSPGNYGLWDQHLALQWVHDNIKNFGGDAGRVTIFGESAGSGSVVYQSLYAGNRGLFQRAIAQSGSITAMWATSRTPKQDAEFLGKLVGCEQTDTGPLVECIRKASPDVLNATINDPTNGLLKINLPFLPTVDGEFIKESPKDLLLGNSPISADDRAFFASLDFLSGINAEEGLVALNSLVAGVGDAGEFEPNRTLFEEELLPFMVAYELDTELPQAVKDILIHEYTDWSDPEDMEKRRTKLVAVYSDMFFTIPLIETISQHNSLATNSKNTYMYLFDILPSTRAMPTPSWGKRANHADELLYVFFEESDGLLSFMAGREDFKPTEWDRQDSKYLITMWTNFAKTG